eukprot:TRINITY_DN7501_c0_g1_i3.p1 TRINITY_DN7501_c0_g1~~TRINITY_DN7501_c0_g1_i3.p1  ORF type:complete len:889 (-),score=248.10 TRINITY_DN7501_c0_g1_i3:68-2734(-)
MASLEAQPVSGALQEILDELHITSLDESDIQAGLDDLNCSDLDVGSGALPEEGDELSVVGLAEDDASSISGGLSAEVNAALAASVPGCDDATMGEGPAGMATLEASLRLSSSSVGGIRTSLHSAPSASFILPAARASSGVLQRSLPSRSALQPHVQEEHPNNLQLLASVAKEQEYQARQIDDLRRSQETRDVMLSLRPTSGAAGVDSTTGPSPFAPATAASAAAPAGAGFRLQMQDLAISEAAYQALRSQRDEELTVREWLQLRFHELRSTHCAESERLQLEVETLREQLVVAQTQGERAQRNLSRREAAAKDLTEELENQRRESRAQLEQIMADLQASKQFVSEHKDKVRRFDEVAQERLQLKEEAKGLREAMATQSSTQLQLSKEHADSMDRLQQLEADCRLAKQDSEAQERRANLLEQTLAHRDDEVSELKAKVEALREKKRELARKAASDQVTTTQEVRSHVETEIRRFQDQAKSDLEAVRTNLNALHEKEVSMFRERLEAAELRNAELLRRVEDEEQKYQALQLSSARIRAELQNEITELSGTLKLRAFEVERAALTHEEVSMARQKLEHENEQLKQQVDVLRKEYYTLEVQNREGRASERAELASLREQLQGYVELEKELDSAIRACAEGPGTLQLAAGRQSGSALKALGEPGPSDADVGEALLIGTTLASAPASAQRRIQQSLILAQELQRRTREAMQAKAKLLDAESEIAHLEGELEASRREAEATLNSEPQAYLLRSLREREAEVLKLRREVRISNTELEWSRQQAERAQGARLKVEADLQKLLAQRQHLEGLKGILAQTTVASLGADDTAPADAGGNFMLARGERRGRAPTQHSQASATPATTFLSSGKAGGKPPWLQILQSRLSAEPDNQTLVDADL